MHRLITAAYGAATLDALHDCVASAKRDDPMAPVTLLLPNNISGVVARRHLATGFGRGREAVAGIYLATLPRLAEQIAAPGLYPRRPATASVVAAAWRTALTTNPGLFAKVKDHPATIRALVDAHRELRDLSSDALAAVADASTLTADVVRMHKSVVELLAAGWYDQTDLLCAAAYLSPSHAADRGELILYLPQRLSLAEARFARSLADHGRLTVIAGLTSVGRADRAVLESVSRTGVIEAPGSVQIPTAGRILHASDSDDEVRTVIRDVLSALETIPAHRIAVLYAAAVPYARLLHEQLAAAGLDLNGPGVRAVPERAVARGFLGVLALADNDLPRADFFEALAEAPVRLEDGRVPVARWERLSRLAGIVVGDDWAYRSDTLIATTQAGLDSERAEEDPNLSRVEGYERDIQAIQALRQFSTDLRDRLTTGSTLSSWTELSNWALDLFHDLYGDPATLRQLPAEEQFAAAAIERSLQGLTLLEEFEDASHLERLREVVELDLEAALPRVGKFGEGIFVGPLSAAVGLAVDRVYILGLSEDIYPGRLRHDALLSERVRTHSDELAAAREGLDAKQRHLLAAFSAGQQAVASFPRGDLRRSTGRLPSRFLLPSLRELTGNRKLAASEWNLEHPQIVGSPSYAAGLAAAPVPATIQEWQIRAAAAHLPGEDSIIASATRMLEARDSKDFTEYDGNLAGSAGLPDFAHSDQFVSPTALEAYAECPHRYFIEKMLKVRPLDSPEAVISISAIDIGNVVHESMDQFITECVDELPQFGVPWTEDQRRRLRGIGATKSDQFEARGLTGHKVLWIREKAALLELLDSMLTEDDEYRSNLGARVVQSELAFGTGETPPVTIEVPGGRVLMRGSADKVDQTRDGLLIVTDIKTGSDRTFKNLKPTRNRPADPVVAGTKLQLPVYAYAARQLLGGDAVRAEYWFVRRQHSRYEVQLDSAVERLYAETIGTLVSSMAAGQFPAKAPEREDFMSSWIQCPYCNPDGIGHGDVRERWERKRHDPSLQSLVELIDPKAVVGQ